MTDIISADSHRWPAHIKELRKRAELREHETREHAELLCEDIRLLQDSPERTELLRELEDLLVYLHERAKLLGELDELEQRKGGVAKKVRAAKKISAAQ